MDDQTEEQAAHTDGDGTPNRSYVPPTLKVYGSIASVTQTVGKGGTVADGGSMRNMSKTS